MTHQESTTARRSRPRPARTHTTTSSTRQPSPAHYGRDPFASATQGPMRRDYALNRFLHLTAGFRRS